MAYLGSTSDTQARLLYVLNKDAVSNPSDSDLQYWSNQIARQGFSATKADFDRTVASIISSRPATTVTQNPTSAVTQIPAGATVPGATVTETPTITTVANGTSQSSEKSPVTLYVIGAIAAYLLLMR